MGNTLVWQCEACGFSVRWRELGLVQRFYRDRSRRLHIGCMPQLEQRRLMRAARGLCCLFCGRSGLTAQELVEHFEAARHGRVLVNW